eukprot:TRINITY_DN1200_c0_g1_i1.p1 TRINITY_DN1200_c0_g1~~TRINITY_DN1200_c0_g1_i1.p1  ORF type:complete len:176 (+),score=30.31 TRINITY_DN1200_c0_g1_i1:33-560(+)
MRKDNDFYDVLYKIVLCGDSGTGKSNILRRFTDNEFIEESRATIGVEFETKTLKFKEKIIKSQIWDTAGQERFKAICSAYYRGANGVLVVFDMTNRKSFLRIEEWLDEIKKNVNSENQTTLILVGNKSDLNSHRTVSFEEAKSFANIHNMMYIETSAKNGSNIEEAFTKLITDIF